MNREEAIQKALNKFGYPTISTSIESLINKIYDDFESRTCESCKFYDGISYVNTPYCTKHHDSWSSGEMYEFSMGKDFCCNSWEAKEEE